MNPTTLNGWVNIFMMKWDSFVDHMETERPIGQS